MTPIPICPTSLLGKTSSTLGLKAERDLQSHLMGALDGLEFIPTPVTDEKLMAWNGVGMWSPASRMAKDR